MEQCARQITRSAAELDAGRAYYQYVYRIISIIYMYSVHTYS